MKILFVIIACCLFTLTASAQLNTDSTQTKPIKTSSHEGRSHRMRDHLHPKFPNLANPSDEGYDMDGTVYKNEAIVNRHITNINDLFR
jgi:hypothetical protein